MAPPARTDRAERWGIVLVCLALCFWIVRRLQYGVDFTDEAVYLAIPKRFLLGDRPFVDEINPIQTASLEALPLYWLQHWITGGFEGMVLYGRCLYFVFSCAVAALAARGFAPVIGTPRALLVALLFVLLVPMGIPNLSYNTLGSGFFVATVFLPLAARTEKGVDRAFFAAGACAALSTIALASYFPACVCAAALALWQGDPARRGLRCLVFLCGGIVVVLAFLPWLMRIDAGTIDYAFQHVTGSGRGLAKAERILRTQVDVLPQNLGVVLGLGIVCASFWMKRWLPCLAAIALLPWTLTRGPEIRASLELCTVLAWCGPVLVALQWNDPALRKLFVRLWIPSALAGFVSAWTSSQLTNSGYGHLPAALFTSAAAVTLAGKALAASASRAPAFLAAGFPAGIALLLASHARAVYRDDPIERLSVRMDHGAFRGLVTTPEKRAYWERLEADVKSLEAPGRRVVFGLTFPAGYLATDMRPAASSAWAISCMPLNIGECTEAWLRDVEPWGKDGVVVFYIRRKFFWTSFVYPQIPNVVEHMLRSDFALVLEREDYWVFRPR